MSKQKQKVYSGITILVLLAGWMAHIWAGQVVPTDNLNISLSMGNIDLTPGTYRLTSKITAVSNRTITAQPGAVIDASGVMTAIDVQNVLNFNVIGVKIINAKDCAIYVYNSTGAIRNCDISGIGGGGQINTAIFGYPAPNFEVTDNHIYDSNEGIHFWWFGNNKDRPTPCLIARNLLEGIVRHPIELQGSPSGVHCVYNYVTKFRPQTNCMGISFAVGGDPGVKIPGTDTTAGPLDINPPNTSYGNEVGWNVIDGSGLQVAANRLSQYAAVEVMGWDTWIHDNYAANFGQPFLVGLNTDRCRIQNNKYRGPKPAWAGGVSGMMCGEDRYVQLASGNDSGNIYTNDPTPPFNGSGPIITNVVATVATNSVKITWNGGPATLTRTDKEGVTDIRKLDGKPAIYTNVTSPWADDDIPLDHFQNTWHIKYLVGGTSSDLIQLQKPDVVVIQPTTLPSYDIVQPPIQVPTIQIRNGLPVNATTKPVQ